MDHHNQNAVATRLFVDELLAVSQTISATPSHAHYLRHVLRIQGGSLVALFNGVDGEWLAEVEFLHKSGCAFKVQKKCRPQESESGPWLLFAPIKQLRLDFLIQKSVELGVELIWPVRTQRTVVRNINPTRIRANAIEAAEQCGRLTVPQTRVYTDLVDILNDWAAHRMLCWGDETGEGAPALEVLQTCAGEAAFLIGPEGGFDDSEREILRGQHYTQAIDLGARLLRSDTASLMVLSLWQGALHHRIRS